MKPNGTWLPVAGGGGYRMGDSSPAPYCNDPSGNCFNGTGGDTDGYVWFTNGHNPWHNEYYWLDGEVYLQTQEGPGDYNVGVSPISKSISSFHSIFRGRLDEVLITHQYHSDRRYLERHQHQHQRCLPLWCLL